jgi:hypothetical protein
MDVMFARRDLYNYEVLIITKRDICFATVARGRLLNHKICKNILFKMKTLESMLVTNVTGGFLIL